MIRYHFGYDETGNARRGKRLRPRLLLLTAQAEGGRIEDALDAAVAIELLHNYSLVHDDIEDGDALRHGRETVWSRFGIPHGINTGDAMCGTAYLTLLHPEMLLPPERVLAMLRVLHEANIKMCEGQGLDMHFERLSYVSAERYFEMIAGKTGALFAASCELGALAAGAALERVAAWAALGRAYGRAFQIRDDVLGTWGVSAVTGKPSGADVARRKWSFPIAWALGRQSSPDREIVARAYAPTNCVEQRDVCEVIAALERLGAREAADEAYEAALLEVREIAERANIDMSGTVREFFREGARRVA
jgi:geranylgeranyl diphosphate synthase, type I